MSGDVASSIPGPQAGDLRRAVSLRSPVSASPSGMASFGLAGSAIHSNAPAASRHPLFSHHAAPAGGPSLNRTDTFMSDPGVQPVPTDSSEYPPSPTGSTLSGSTAASAFLSNFGRGRAMSIASIPGQQLPPPAPAPDAAGAKVLGYTLGKVLGRGGFSTVRLATNEATGETLACKIVKRDDLSDQSGSLECFEDEIRLWKELPSHAALIPLIDIHRTSYATFMFMPILAGGSLVEVVRREGSGRRTVRKYFPGVVAAVEVLHEGYGSFEGNILHGDLKLDNFIADENDHLRLGDFGMARRIPPPAPGHGKPPGHHHARHRMASAPTLPRGRHTSRSPDRRQTLAEVVPEPANVLPSASLPYAPPELLCVPPQPRSLKQDTWAMGVILYALLTGCLPFRDSFDPRLQMKIINGHFDEPEADDEWLEVLYGCLERDVRKRWDIRRIRESDALSGWHTSKPKKKSRSRSRVRICAPPDSPSLAELSELAAYPRSRSHSRMRLAATPGHHAHHTHSNSFGTPSSAHYHELTPTWEERAERDHRPPRRGGTENRSRSGSSRRGRHSGDMHALLSAGNEDGLVVAFDEVAISRGRSSDRTTHTADQSRDGSASSLRVPDPYARGQNSPNGSRPTSWSTGPSSPAVGHPQEQHTRARSRTRRDGVQVPVPGSGPPTVREQWHQRGHGDTTPRSRGSPSWATGESRPPTVGFELFAVDEEERGRRGREPPPPTRGRSRSARRQ